MAIDLQPGSREATPRKRRSHTWFGQVISTTVGFILIAGLGGAIVLGLVLNSAHHSAAPVITDWSLPTDHAAAYRAEHHLDQPAVGSSQSTPHSCLKPSAQANDRDQLTVALNDIIYGEHAGNKACVDSVLLTRTYGTDANKDIGQKSVTVLSCIPWGGTGVTDIFYRSGGTDYNAHVAVMRRTDGSLVFYDLPEFSNQTPVVHPPGDCSLAPGEAPAYALAG